MPAYRSDAEGEIRDAVVARIRERRPQARVIHEINVSGPGSNRVDLIAVDRAEIIAFEIKSAKDKLDRLPAQIEAMRAAAHSFIVALHEKFLEEQVTNPHAAHYERDGKFFLRRLPDLVPRGTGWVYPERRRAMTPTKFDDLAAWPFPNYRLERPLPAGALDFLHRDELYDLCGQLRVSTGRRATMGEMILALRWHCTGKELTLGICAALRRRSCSEADPAITDVAA